MTKPPAGCTSTGAVQWQRAYGGDSLDMAIKVEVHPAGGFVIGGYSYSPSSYDKLSVNKGDADYWIIRVSESGDLLWETSVGSAGSDILWSIAVADNGTTVATGYTSGEASGDRTRSTYGSSDCWIVALDKSGDLIWEQTYGTTDSDDSMRGIEVIGNQVFVAGSTAFDPDGDRTSTVAGDTDGWLLSLSLTDGSLAWERTYGGSNRDGFGDARSLPDGRLALGGWTWIEDSESPSGGDTDSWIVVVDPDTGDVDWETTRGGLRNEGIYGMTVSQWGAVHACGVTSSGIGRDVLDEPRGNDDYWMFKVTPPGRLQAAGSALESVESDRSLPPNNN